jgi:hypothetical protein
MQQWRNPLDQLKPDESRQDEYIKIGNEIRWHDCSSPLSVLLDLRCSAAALKSLAARD